MRQIENKIVIVTRATRLKQLKERFSTRSQARFYVEHMGADFSDYEKEDEGYETSLRHVRELVSQFARTQILDRNLLPNYIFGPQDIVITLGQDGLVANTLKYLNGQPVIGVNPDPKRWDGKLLPFHVSDLTKIVPEVQAGRRQLRDISMAKATLNNKATMLAVNDLFIGHRSHGSAQYVIHVGQQKERHSSSGVIISTGLGSSGWLKSVLTGAVTIAQKAGTNLSRLPDNDPQQELLPVMPMLPEASLRKPPPISVRTEFPWDSRHLFFMVREPFPTRNTGTSLVFGKLTAQKPLVLVSQMSENGVIFSDGIEHDFLQFNSGTKVTVGLAEKLGKLVV